jgi:hypothetical protein
MGMSGLRGCVEVLPGCVSPATVTILTNKEPVVRGSNSSHTTHLIQSFFVSVVLIQQQVIEPPLAPDLIESASSCLFGLYVFIRVYSCLFVSFFLCQLNLKLVIRVENYLRIHKL